MKQRNKLISSEERAVLIAKFASEKKAEDIIILDMRKISNFCDYFVICNGTSDRRVKAIAKGIDEGLEKINIKIWHAEGEREALWILLDIGDIIVHIFDKKVRDFYNLEYLWRDAPQIAWDAN